ncbi:DUF2500 domain-containing protein [Clostridium lundense]|uniref:DUF2500 domain-containing protein n=1 Tax=Clostridium lundense TaxID=319475 RepID=UPI000684EE2F|nr:DUF2500 domain-containing protein [Clostridium lundense]
MPFYGFDDLLFSIFPIIFFIIFGFMVFSMIKSYVKNSQAPIITVESKIIGKRTNVSHHTHNDANNNISHSTSTTYYITFQTEHGERLELSLSGRMYGLLAEGDVGDLTYQGEWFKDFKRKNNSQSFNNNSYEENKDYREY